MYIVIRRIRANLILASIFILLILYVYVKEGIGVCIDDCNLRKPLIFKASTEKSQYRHIIKVNRYDRELTGEEDSYISYFKKVVDEKPSRMNYFNLAEKLLDVGKFEDAFIYYSKALGIEGESSISKKEILYAISHFFILQGEYRGAIFVYEAISEMLKERMENDIEDVDEELFLLDILKDFLIKLGQIAFKQKIDSGDISQKAVRVIETDIEKAQILEEMADLLENSEGEKKRRLLELALDTYRTAQNFLKFTSINESNNRRVLRSRLDIKIKEIQCKLCKISVKWYKICNLTGIVKSDRGHSPDVYNVVSMDVLYFLKIRDLFGNGIGAVHLESVETSI